MLDLLVAPRPPCAEDYCVLFCDGQLVTPFNEDVTYLWTLSEAETYLDASQEWVYVGMWRGQRLFAFTLPPANVDPMGLLITPLLRLLTILDSAVFDMLGRAQQLLSARRQHRFCGQCGIPTDIGTDGAVRHCAPCGMTYYPRIAPCVIFGITRGDSLLLARSAVGNRPFFSTLAGFIEAGETAEQAVLREAREEVGLIVDNVRYVGSQPWAFPSQLMLGFLADWAEGDIMVDGIEIAEADFFYSQSLPPIPPQSSISGRMIRSFFDQ